MTVASCTFTSIPKPELACCYLQLKHSRTSSSSSYREDFQQLIDIYGKKKKTNWMKQTTLMKQTRSPQEVEEQSDSSFGSVSASDDDDEVKSIEEHVSTASRGREMTVEYLESEADIFQNADDWDGTDLLLGDRFCTLCLLKEDVII